jgi:hypothetical protein
MFVDSVITRVRFGADIIESPIFQNYKQCFDEYHTWLMGHRAGMKLIAQAALLDSAIDTLYRLAEECLDDTYEFEQQGPQMSQSQQDLYTLTQWCRSRATYIDTRRESTFVEFSTLKGYLFSRIQRAWNLGCPSAEQLTRQITKEGWANASRARWRAELDWRFGRTSKRPRHIMMMPRTRVIVDQALDNLVIENRRAMPSSSSSQSNTTGAQQLGGLPDRTGKDNPT